MPYFAIQNISFRNGTSAMYNKDWQTAFSSAAASAVSRKMESKSSNGDDANSEKKDAVPQEGDGSGDQKN